MELVYVYGFILSCCGLLYVCECVYAYVFVYIDDDVPVYVYVMGGV